MEKLTGFNKGVNLGGWLSQCVHTKEHYDSFITRKDIENLSKWNVDHVRVPVDYNLVEDAEGNYLEEGFAYIQSAIDWCREYGLNMVLDLHKTFGYSFDEGENEVGFFDNEAYQERFYRLWDQFTTRFAKNDDMLAFELLNEVTAREYNEVWTKIALKAIELIRKQAPNIKILIGGYYNNSVVAVPDLPVIDDKNVIYNFHCYDPLNFTHQGASWLKDMPLDFRMKFEDSGVSEEYFEELFAPALRTAEERGKILYCGEYGCIDKMEEKYAFQWYRCIHKIFKKYGIGSAAWSYKKMDFGLTDDTRKEIVKEFF